MNGTLGVAESDDAFLVIVDDEPEDWLVRFEKSDAFPAGHWAHNMARAYNERRTREAIDPGATRGAR